MYREESVAWCGDKIVEENLGDDRIEELDETDSWDTDMAMLDAGIATKPMTLEDLEKILGITIKHDSTNKLITFLTMLSAYTEDNQINASFRAPSSTGKSYIPLELSSLFENVIEIAYASPTAFFHDNGEWDEEKQAIIVNLERKILIFVDQPHDDLLHRLRPLLSHDRKELIYKITDKKEKKGLRTKNVIIRGYPAVIFCTGSLKMDEQEATRNILLSPETTGEKIREALFLKGQREGNALSFKEQLTNNLDRKLLKMRIREIKKANINYIVVPEAEKIVGRFLAKHPKLKPRHQRDLGRLFNLIKTWALFNLWHRERDENNNLIANEEDLEVGFKLWEDISETQELGIPPYVFRVFKEVVEPICKEFGSVERKQIIAKHYEVYGRPIQDWFLRQQIIPALEGAGLILQEPDENDRRKMLITLPPQSDSL